MTDLKDMMLSCVPCQRAVLLLNLLSLYNYRGYLTHKRHPSVNSYDQSYFGRQTSTYIINMGLIIKALIFLIFCTTCTFSDKIGIPFSMTYQHIQQTAHVYIIYTYLFHCIQIPLKMVCSKRKPPDDLCLGG